MQGTPKGEKSGQKTCAGLKWTEEVGLAFQAVRGWEKFPFASWRFASFEKGHTWAFLSACPDRGPKRNGSEYFKRNFSFS